MPRSRFKVFSLSPNGVGNALTPQGLLSPIPRCDSMRSELVVLMYQLSSQPGRIHAHDYLLLPVRDRPLASASVRKCHLSSGPGDEGRTSGWMGSPRRWRAAQPVVRAGISAESRTSPSAPRNRMVPPGKSSGLIHQKWKNPSASAACTRNPST